MKKRKVFIILFSILLTIHVVSQEQEKIYRDGFNSIIIKTDQIIVNEFDRNTISLVEQVYPYNIESRFGVPFIESTEENQPDLLILFNEQFANLYFAEKRPLSQMTLYTRNKRLEYDYSNIRNALEYKASSYLVENKTHYLPENLGDNSLSKPWVEGVEGAGIGETLWLKWQIWSRGGIGALIISNGYVSYNNPSLFTKNNRVKRIRVKDLSGAFDFETELLDTPNPQVVFLPEAVEEMQIEILSVYKGTLWDDTCLNYIDGLEINQARWLHEEMSNNGQKILGMVSTVNNE